MRSVLYISALDNPGGHCVCVCTEKGSLHISSRGNPGGHCEDVY